MVFIDNLAFELFVLFFSAALLLYVIITAYFKFSKAKKEFEGIKDGMIPVFIVGFFIFANALAEELMWSLPGSYNILFYDPFMMFGILLMSLSIAIFFGKKINSIGFLSLLFGVIIILYGIFGYNLNMTKAPQMLLGLYGFFGLAGIFAYPATLVYDFNKRSSPYLFAFALFIIFLALAGVAALALGAISLPAHLASPP
ncbi:MAG: DUF981 family protein [Candidatus Marsarchaeota archaeon]|nr:DUF981 family protein [Candidatus Marsarchaeota archaeon]MCL5106098.1 DUF981 family protein [Candidatus Marsarchaeota archaeon]